MPKAVEPWSLTRPGVENRLWSIEELVDQTSN